MFDTVNYLLFEKNKNELDNELLETFVPYMVGRYLSFYDKGYVDYVNDTINTYGSVFHTKEDQFRFYENVIPNLKRKKISYIKRPKESKKKETEPLPIPEFFSKREMDIMDYVS